MVGRSSDAARRQTAGALAFQADTGVVAWFDETRGLGAIRASNGAELPFHCTAIANGARTIPVGERVRYLVVPAALGGWEATHIEPC